MPGPGHQSQDAFVGQEMARHRRLRKTTLDWLGIGPRSRGSKELYIAALAGLLRSLTAVLAE